MPKPFSCLQGFYATAGLVWGAVVQFGWSGGIVVFIICVMAFALTAKRQSRREGSQGIIGCLLQLYSTKECGCRWCGEHRMSSVPGNGGGYERDAQRSEKKASFGSAARHCPEEGHE
jgi:hypothetical protein